jgi:hypothetical protein
MIFRMAVLFAALVPGVAFAGALPTLKVRTLSGVVMSWPADLPEPGAALVLAQDEAQQAHAATWLPFLNSGICAGAALGYYIVPVLPEGLLIVRSLVEQAIRRASDDPAMHARTVPLFADIARLQTAMAVAPTQDVQVVVVGRDGNVHASVSGPYSPETAQILLSALASSPGTGQVGLCPPAT